MNKIHSLGRLPLIPLRCFESFARLSSVASAAQELGISPSGVSHQLAGLEASLGMALTERKGRKLLLNAVGRSYFEAVSPAFATLQNATLQLKEGALPERLHVSALPSVATSWLMPCINAFMIKNQDVLINIGYTRYSNYSADAADVSLRFGLGTWPGYSAEKILDGGTIPICSPTVEARFGPFNSPADFAKVPLIHDGIIEHWKEWLEDQHISFNETPPGMICEDGLLVKFAALAGVGVALMRPVIVEHELKIGSLIRVSDYMQRDNRHYYLCIRNDREVPNAVRRLRAWLKECARGIAGSHV